MKIFNSGKTQGPTPEQLAATQLENERAQVAAMKADLRSLCMSPWPGRRSRIWAVAGGKGGSLKTTTAAVLAHYIGEAMMLMTVCADLNPDLVTLHDRVIRTPSRGRLVDLAEVAAKLTYPIELLEYLEFSAYGRELYLTSSGVRRHDVHALQAQQLQEVRFLLSVLAQATIYDTGTTYESAHFQTALGGADQLALGFTAGLDTLGKVGEVFAEIAEAGHVDLLVDQTDPIPSWHRGGASVLVSVDGPNVQPAQLGQIVDWISVNAGAAFVVPYDPALDSRTVTQLILWDQIAPATEIALLHFVLHAVRSAVTRPPRVTDLQATIERTP